ncbi:delta endotoxin C-terminal domain-containing protein [Bacillus thuringiensis]|uniref:Delta endotoxin C-terminal domain-containing protein n=1 Tax=Bacillus thuringiensis TaxID=1428 RepID=A0AAW9GRW4_BACTU|nr:delta endotoxin C-terminal domain-containing protein [Bacillus thuringiensis]MDY0853823.1 delta endotoxin C-terminal domain-containing protein [Bacillus thuringiensis]MDY4393787.1 delta endotoxin C-terminal domain-containing protein [Bacillus thuringiensis]
MITTISAAKYNLGISNFQPQVESIHANQKAMKTSTTSSYLAYGIRISKELEYRIRYKVAANVNSKISLSHRKSSSNYTKIADTNPPTNNAENAQGQFSLDQIELETINRDEVIAQEILIIND